MNTLPSSVKPFQGVLKIIEITVYLFFILVYPMYLLFYGLDFTDGPFHYYNFESLGHISSLTFLSTHIAHWWYSFFGGSILSYRIFTFILRLTGILIPVLIIIGKEANFRKKIRFVAIAMILSSAMAANILNWDVFTVFFLSLIFTVTFLYLKSDSKYYILVLAVLTALATAVRLPNIIVIVPIACIVLFKESTKNTNYAKRFLSILLLFSTTVGVYYLLRIFLYNPFELGPSSLTPSANITSTSQSFTLQDLFYSMFYGDGPYSLKNLAGRYLRDGIRIFEMIGVILLTAFFWRKKNESQKNTLLFIIPIVLFYLTYFFLYVLTSKYNFYLSFFYSAFVFFLVGYLSFDTSIRKDTNTLIFLLFSVILGFISAFGSDTGLLKLTHSYFFILPVLLHFTFKNLKKTESKGLYMLILLLVVFSISNKLLVGRTYQDGRLWSLNTTIEHPRLQGIRTNELRKKQIDRILMLTDEIKEKDPDAKFIFYGNQSHLYRYLTGEETGFNGQFGMPFDLSLKESNFEGNLLNNKLNSYVFLILDYPEFSTTEDGGLIAEELKDVGYRRINEGKGFLLFAYGAKESSQI